VNDHVERPSPAPGEAAPAPDTEPAYTEEDFGHPRGTLAIVLIYALIFALSWGGLYVFQFLGRGAPQP
jgi:hypothetical protein